MRSMSTARGTSLVRCGGCDEKLRAGETLRRGRCPRCYDQWVKARPIGMGAQCAACDNRRRQNLRHYELGGAGGTAVGARWVVLCHNCANVADGLTPPPRSLDGLKMRLQRDRRWGDRRAAAVGGSAVPPKGMANRRKGDRREPRFLDPNDLHLEEDKEEVLELEADYERPEDLIPRDLESKLAEIDEVTSIHRRFEI